MRPPGPSFISLTPLPTQRVPKGDGEGKRMIETEPWNVERFLEDLLLVVKGQSNLDIDGYL